ncbi:MAG: hypothetical protein AAGI28_04430 [Pseudomonadota bacterium]
MADYLTWALVFFGGLAAAFWLYSANCKVRAQEVIDQYRKETGSDSGSPAQIVVDDEFDFVASALKQSRWSADAAVAAAASIALQSAALALGSV